MTTIPTWCLYAGIGLLAANVAFVIALLRAAGRPLPQLQSKEELLKTPPKSSEPLTTAPLPKIRVRQDSVSMAIMLDYGMQTETILQMAGRVYTPCGDNSFYWLIPWTFSSVYVPKAACEIID